MVFLSLLKSLISILAIMQGYHAKKTFKPILKKQNDVSTNYSSSEKHSEKVQEYKKRVKKIIVASIAVMFVSAVMSISFLNKTAD
jgi:p-aminobenzoyl-glutamate transporter AbgT